MRSNAQLLERCVLMNKVTKVKQSLQKEKWIALIKDCQSSGLTIRAWCEQNNIKEQTYYRNLHKLRAELCEQLPVPATTEDKPVVFQPLQVDSPVANTKAAVIVHMGNTTVEINEGTSRDTIQAVLLALQSAC